MTMTSDFEVVSQPQQPQQQPDYSDFETVAPPPHADAPQGPQQSQPQYASPQQQPPSMIPQSPAGPSYADAGPTFPAQQLLNGYTDGLKATNEVLKQRAPYVQHYVQTTGTTDPNRTEAMKLQELVDSDQRMQQNIAQHVAQGTFIHDPGQYEDAIHAAADARAKLMDYVNTAADAGEKHLAEHTKTLSKNLDAATKDMQGAMENASNVGFVFYGPDVDTETQRQFNTLWQNAQDKVAAAKMESGVPGEQAQRIRDAIIATYRLKNFFTQATTSAELEKGELRDADAADIAKKEADAYAKGQSALGAFSESAYNAFREPGVPFRAALNMGAGGDGRGEYQQNMSPLAQQGQASTAEAFPLATATGGAIGSQLNFEGLGSMAVGLGASAAIENAASAAVRPGMARAIGMGAGGSAMNVMQGSVDAANQGRAPDLADLGKSAVAGFIFPNVAHGVGAVVTKFPVVQQLMESVGPKTAFGLRMGASASNTGVSSVLTNYGLATATGQEYTSKDAARDFLVGVALDAANNGPTKLRQLAEDMAKQSKSQGAIGQWQVYFEQQMKNATTPEARNQVMQDAARKLVEIHFQDQAQQQYDAEKGQVPNPIDYGVNQNAPPETATDAEVVQPPKGMGGTEPPSPPASAAPAPEPRVPEGPGPAKTTTAEDHVNQVARLGLFGPVEKAARAGKPDAEIAKSLGLKEEQVKAVRDRLGIVQPTPASPSTPQADLSNLPDYAREEIERAHKTAEKAGILDAIENAAMRRLTAKQTALEIGNKLQGALSDRAEIIRAAKVKMGIPSQDDTADFEAWVKSKSPPAPKQPMPQPAQAVEAQLQEQVKQSEPTPHAPQDTAGAAAEPLPKLKPQTSVTWGDGQRGHVWSDRGMGSDRVQVVDAKTNKMISVDRADVKALTAESMGLKPGDSVQIPGMGNGHFKYVETAPDGRFMVQDDETGRMMKTDPHRLEQSSRPEVAPTQPPAETPGAVGASEAPAGREQDSGKTDPLSTPLPVIKGDGLPLQKVRIEALQKKLRGLDDEADRLNAQLNAPGSTIPQGEFRTKQMERLERMTNVVKEGHARLEAMMTDYFAKGGVEPDHVGAEEVVQTPKEKPQPLSPHENLAADLAQRIAKGEKITGVNLIQAANKHFGGTVGQGKYNIKDAYDAMELAVNQHIAAHPEKFNPTVDLAKAEESAKALADIKNNLPTQTRRTGESQSFQQFSTPPDYAFAANWIANLKPGETALEPSAGVGGLAVFAKNAGADVHVNELAPRRADLLKAMGFPHVTTENAEQISNTLDVKPTVVVMNPPFSQTAGRMGDKKMLGVASDHIAQAFSLMPEGGRLVAIVGEGMKPGAPTYAAFFKKMAPYLVANVGVSGDVYKKYGTTFGTRVLVFDKAAQAGRVPVTGDVPDVLQLMQTLQGVRDARIAPTEQPADQSGVQAGNDQTGGRTKPGKALHPVADGVGDGSGIAPSDRPQSSAPAGQHGGRSVKSPAPSGDAAPVPDAGTAEGNSGQPPVAAPGKSGGGSSGISEPRNAPGVKLTESESSPEEPKASTEISEAVFENYKPQKVRIAGAQPHPTGLVESAAMGSVSPPVAKYTPNIDPEVIKSGHLSDAQLEPIVYAGQAHAEFLPDGARRGYFVGDGTGVGKGAIAAGIFQDNWNRGRTKGVWISENFKLFPDAQRDLEWVGGNKDVLFPQNKTKVGLPIDKGEGILFTGYGTLKSGLNGPDRNSRLKQIIKWLGKDFDGVIAFDEAHNMKSGVPTQGARGKTAVSDTATAGIELQKALPKARIVYLSATGATEVSNLAYAQRLGLWGEGTPFPSVSEFINQIKSGGVAAMELVARDMKQMGAYLARNLSFDGVKYKPLEHTLTPDQIASYDKLTEGWQVVLRNINAALAATGGAKSKDAKSAAYSAFWGGHQRFFNQVITAMQLPTMLKDMDEQLANDKSLVVQLTNTNEAAMDRSLAKLEAEGGDIEDMDLTPRDGLMQMITHSFPVHQYESYVDEDGKEGSRLVVDSKGNPVENREAVAMRKRLLIEVGSISVPEGPLEQIINHFGPENVAENTGRTQRVVRYMKNGKEETKREPRSKTHALADVTAFNAGKKRVLVFSAAGGTGATYAANKLFKNQQQRIHYLAQAGWVADKAVQGFGRTHRANQSSAPLYQLVTTDLPGQKRFISSIARRLDQLGAITKGQRQAASTGIFKETDNLESQYAKDALDKFYHDLHEGKVPGISITDFMNQTGMRLVDPQGNLLRELPPITQFLNRMLSLRTQTQHDVFDSFSGTFADIVKRAKDNGTYDAGVETVKAHKIVKNGEQTVFTDKRSGAETKMVDLTLSHKTNPLPWGMIGSSRTGTKPPVAFVQNSRSGQIYALTEGPMRTLANGSIVASYRKYSPSGTSESVIAKLMLDPEHWTAISDQKRQKELWDAAVEKTPKVREEPLHMITGAILPIWDRVRGQPKVYRLQTDTGERVLGRVVPEEDVSSTLKNLGIGSGVPKWSPEQALTHVMDNNYRLTLANDWVIKRTRAGGDSRMELIGPSWRDMGILEKYGVFSETHQFKTRNFIPTDSPDALAKVLEYHPIAEAEKGAGGAPSFSKSPIIRTEAELQAMTFAQLQEVRKEWGVPAGGKPRLIEMILEKQAKAGTMLPEGESNDRTGQEAGAIPEQGDNRLHPSGGTGGEGGQQPSSPDQYKNSAQQTSGGDGGAVPAENQVSADNRRAIPGDGASRGGGGETPSAEGYLVRHFFREALLKQPEYQDARFFTPVAPEHVAARVLLRRLTGPKTELHFFDGVVKRGQSDAISGFILPPYPNQVAINASTLPEELDSKLHHEAIHQIAEKGDPVYTHMVASLGDVSAAVAKLIKLSPFYADSDAEHRIQEVVAYAVEFFTKAKSNPEIVPPHLSESQIRNLYPLYAQFVNRDISGESIATQKQDSSPLFLQATKILDEKMGESAYPVPIRAMLLNGGIKLADMQSMGLDRWLGERRGPIAKADVIEFLRQNSQRASFSKDSFLDEVRGLRRDLRERFGRVEARTSPAVARGLIETVQAGPAAETIVKGFLRRAFDGAPAKGITGATPAEEFIQLGYALRGDEMEQRKGSRGSLPSLGTNLTARLLAAPYMKQAIDAYNREIAPLITDIRTRNKMLMNPNAQYMPFFLNLAPDAEGNVTNALRGVNANKKFNRVATGDGDYEADPQQMLSAAVAGHLKTDAMQKLNEAIRTDAAVPKPNVTPEQIGGKLVWTDKYGYRKDSIVALDISPSDAPNPEVVYVPEILADEYAHIKRDVKERKNLYTLAGDAAMRSVLVTDFGPHTARIIGHVAGRIAQSGQSVTSLLPSWLGGNEYAIKRMVDMNGSKPMGETMQILLDKSGGSGKQLFDLTPGKNIFSKTLGVGHFALTHPDYGIDPSARRVIADAYLRMSLGNTFMDQVEQDANAGVIVPTEAAQQIDTEIKRQFGPKADTASLGLARMVNGTLGFANRQLRSDLLNSIQKLFPFAGTQSGMIPHEITKLVTSNFNPKGVKTAVQQHQYGRAMRMTAGMLASGAMGLVLLMNLANLLTSKAFDGKSRFMFGNDEGHKFDLYLGKNWYWSNLDPGFSRASRITGVKDRDFTISHYGRETFNEMASSIQPMLRALFTLSTGKATYMTKGDSSMTVPRLSGLPLPTGRETLKNAMSGDSLGEGVLKDVGNVAGVQLKHDDNGPKPPPKLKEPPTLKPPPRAR